MGRVRADDVGALFCGHYARRGMSPGCLGASLRPVAMATDLSASHAFLGVAGEWHTAAEGVRWRKTTILDESLPLEWLVLRVDLGQALPAAVAAPDENLLALATDPSVLMAVNSGYFDDAHRPNGLLVSEIRVIASRTRHGGSGILLLRNHRCDLVDSDGPFPSLDTLDLGLQCGPRLIEPNQEVGIHRDDGQRAARTAVCLRDQGRTMDFVLAWSADDPIRGPGLLSFARLLAGRSPVGDASGCDRALNLDGGPSTGIYVRGAAEATHAPVGPVPWTLVIRAPPTSTP